MKQEHKLGIFEKYLTLWVLLCIVIGILIGNITGTKINVLSDFTIANVNIPIAILVWLMIYPMMVQVDFLSLKNISKNYKGIVLTVFINWILKPLTMAIFAYLFFYKIYNIWIIPKDSEQFLAGAILLGAAPCTAMVFVWSYLTNGNVNYTLIQVSVNDLILLIAFVPIVAMLFSWFDIGQVYQFNNTLGIPYKTLFVSLFLFVLIPLVFGFVTNQYIVNKRGKEWLQQIFLKRFKPISILALLLTLILIFAFQGEVILQNPFLIFLLVIPLTIQTYFIFFISWFIGKKLKLTHSILAPASLIGASNFFELAVAVAISLFGINSGASLITVVGVLIEVPVMLSLVKIANGMK